MWPLPKMVDELVTIHYDPHNLVLSWIRPDTRHRGYLIQAYRHHFFDTPHHHLHLFNPTQLATFIKNFLVHYTLQDAAIMLSLSGSTLMESIIKLPNSTPDAAAFITPSLRTLLWDYHYLYPTDYAAHAFYVCGLSRHLLFQYKLLAINASLNLIGITTQFLASLNLYHTLYGPAFRHAQLARDMTLSNNQLLNVFSTDTLRRMLTIAPSLTLNLEAELPWIATSLGLYTAGKNV